MKISNNQLFSAAVQIYAGRYAAQTPMSEEKAIKACIATARAIAQEIEDEGCKPIYPDGEILRGIISKYASTCKPFSTYKLRALLVTGEQITEKMAENMIMRAEYIGIIENISSDNSAAYVLRTPQK